MQKFRYEQSKLRRFCSRLKALATGSSRLFMAASGRVEGCDDSETKILFSLGSDGYATEAELIEKIGLPRKKFYACVKSLVEKGFVARFRSPIKRNAIYLELTDDALLSVAKAEKAADAFLFAGLSKCGRAADVREISAALQRTAELLKDMERAANFRLLTKGLRGRALPPTRPQRAKQGKTHQAPPLRRAFLLAKCAVPFITRREKHILLYEKCGSDIKFGERAI